MELIFELVGAELPAQDQQASKTFKQAGGLIGRAESCDWVIVDNQAHVSSEHAKITFSDGEFFLTDLSTNGTQVLQSGQRLHQNLRRGETHLIEHGSRYRMGKFEIHARLIKSAAGFVGHLGSTSIEGTVIPDDSFLNLDLLREGGQQVGLDLGFDELTPTYASQQASEQGVDYGSADRQSLLLPELVPEPQPAATIEPVQREPQSDDFWMRFGAAIGIDLLTLDQGQREALAINSAALLKQSIGGLQQTLRTRSELKNELRLTLSMAQHGGNNPLKYAGDASEAIGLLLQAQRAGQLPGDQAIARAFRDIQAHQVALLAASRKALHGALAHFSPQHLALRFERDMRSRLFHTNAARWKAFERYHHMLCQDDDWSERLLARDFAQAYEEQVRLIATLHTEY
ncbi:type VI secretion system-associated FHA domain protein TagH [Pseudomonas quasicaspiana]|nr:type VI secretion system-associated FHA domain protein TagH [Pseudomonas quasicaspiana]